MMRLMSESVSACRKRALRVAQWLVGDGRPGEAVLVLSAWAALGPNDKEGQELMAEALRVDPSSKEAQMAFERMEGIDGDHVLLDQAITKYDEAELKKLEREFKKPTFRKAQMGFNNNIKFQGQVYHVQTEDSGLDAPHIITHLFAGGGRVIKSHKRSYEDKLQTESDIANYVRGLMKAQHLEMVLALRDGELDAIIEGKEVGGMEVLTQPPRERVRPVVVEQPSKPSVPPKEPEAETPHEPLYKLLVIRSLGGGPQSYAPTSKYAVLGSTGTVPLAEEPFCHPEEAVLIFEEGALALEDREGGNGVFLRIRSPVALEFGSEFVVGDQLLRLEQNPVPDDAPDPDPTYFYSSPKWPSAFRVIQVLEGGAIGATVVAQGNALQIGSAVGDLVFAEDPLVAHQHCVVEEQAGVVLLSDLNSRSGVFVRVQGRCALQDADEILIGRTRLRLSLDT
jgi:hypothetical protein